MISYTNGWTFTCRCGFSDNLTFTTIESEGINHRIFHRFFRDYCIHPTQEVSQSFEDIDESNSIAEDNNSSNRTTRRNRRGRRRRRATPENTDAHNHPFDGLEV